MANQGCISFYGKEQCHRKCRQSKCPGSILKGKCLSETGYGEPAPPLNFDVEQCSGNFYLGQPLNIT